LIASALVSGCLTLKEGQESNPAAASTALVGKEVLEVGCGRGLAGIVAGNCGARRVVHSDCDDRCLADIAQMALDSEQYCIRHHLWEQDQAREEEGHSNTKIRHCSDSHRNENMLEMESDVQFDLVIAADCLYFSSQEEPLASVLRQRVRKPDGYAVICMQPRHENSFMFARFIQHLRDSGFAIHHTDEFDWLTLMNSGVTMDTGYIPALVPSTKPGADSNRHHIVLASWPTETA
jgi:2-polyprenyl-3-methyl-5-hydroxy-6-metoxy-1,4-benzoquinol methylase